MNCIACKHTINGVPHYYNWTAPPPKIEIGTPAPKPVVRRLGPYHFECFERDRLNGVLRHVSTESSGT